MFCKDIIPLVEQSPDLLEFHWDGGNFSLDVLIKDLSNGKKEGGRVEAPATHDNDRGKGLQ